MNKIVNKIDTDDEIESLPLDRRAFLASSGALVVTLAAPGGVGPRKPPPTAPPRGRRSPATSSPPTSPSRPTARCVAYYGKIDGGQGLGTSIAQMVAEEIDVPFEQVRIVMGDSGRTLDMGGASAAIGVSHGGMVLRRTAAQARHLLIEQAAQALGLPADQLTVTDGVVHPVADPQARHFLCAS